MTPIAPELAYAIRMSAKAIPLDRLARIHKLTVEQVREIIAAAPDAMPQGV